MKHATTGVWLHHYASGRQKALACLNDLMRSQWWSRTELESWQLDRLRRTLGIASGLPYYRDLFRRIGLKDPRDVRSPQDLNAIPPLTKEIVRRHLDDLTTSGPGLVANQTGGSTGVPVRFFADAEWLAYQKPAANTRPYCVAGFRLGDPIAVLWGMDSDLHRGGRWEDFLRRQVYRQFEFNAFALTADSLREAVRTIRTENIRFVKGYAGALHELARFLLDSGEPPLAGLRGVFSEAESLDADRRATIERALGVRVSDIYGCREFGTIAYECPERDGYHINAEQLLVELAGNEILVTSFMERGTVFLRYALGDLAGVVDPTPCACGRQAVRLRELRGRISDSFVTRDGRMVHGEVVTHMMYRTAAIEQFQVIQKEVDHFVFRYVTRDPETAAHELRGVQEALEAQFGYRLRFDLETVSALPKTANGKYRFTISELTGSQG